MTDSRLFTVLGGTGFLGSRIARELLNKGHRVRIAARHPHRCRPLVRHSRAEPFCADLLEPASLAKALDGAEGAANATSLYVEQGDMTFDSVHVEAAGRAAALAREERLRHFVQISGIGADAGAGNSYISARGRGEVAVLAAFSDATVVRPAVMFGEDDALLSAILRTGRRSPVFPLFGRGRTRLQPVFADDVARAVAGILTGGAAEPVYEFGGPRVLTYRALVNEVLDAVGLHRPFLPVPFAVWRGLAAVAEHLPGAPLTRTQVALVQRNNVADHDLPGLSDLGVAATDMLAFVNAAYRK